MKDTINARIDGLQQAKQRDGIFRPWGNNLAYVESIARLLRVPYFQRSELVQWLDREGLWVEPPTLQPLADHPLAGCVDLDVLREALNRALDATGALPFPSALEPQP